VAKLWSWGGNGLGQLGLEDILDRSSPEQVGALTNWSSIAAGGAYHTLATKTDGSLWSWGRNTEGQLGQEDIIHRSSPVQVGALTDWSSVAGGLYHTLATKTDGSLWSWGDNTNGELGLEDILDRSSPEQVGALTNWSSAACGYYHTLAIKTDGSLWSWGDNLYGQLGLEDILDRSSPVQVGALTTWSSVACGAYHTLATKTDGTLWSWGYNNNGQLGQEDIIHRSSPVQVGALTGWGSVVGGAYQTLGIQGPIEIEDVVITSVGEEAIGEWCWGHDTSVEEENVADLSEGTGTGTVTSTGDAEYLTLLGGQTWTLPAVQTGEEEIEITYDKYENQDGAGAGSGGPGLIEYRTGADQATCEAAGWNTYTVHFTSSGWVQVRVTNNN